VRAATKGLIVSEVNCHPFQHGRFLWMHNGHVAEFRRVKRRLRESLGDEAYDLIQGTTDSEHAFALFLDGLGGRGGHVEAEALEERMIATIRTLDGWGREAGIEAPSFLNFAVTDGRSVVASRYVSRDHPEPATLYYSCGARFEARNGAYRMAPSAAGEPHGAAIIASEPLTEDRSDWRPVPRNHLVTITPELEVRLRAVA
jgi:glutamine amidotransferase